MGLSLVAVSGDYFLVSTFRLLCCGELSCCQARTLGYPGSAAVSPGFGCSGMQNLPGSGIQHTSPTLAGVFLTTEPQGKSYNSFKIYIHIYIIYACDIRKATWIA